MAQIVARQEAVQFWEFIDNQLAIVATAFQHGAVDATGGGLVFAERLGQFDRYGLGIENIPTQQHRPHAKDVIGGFAVHQRPLAGGVGVDHPTESGAVTGR